MSPENIASFFDALGEVADGRRKALRKASHNEKYISSREFAIEIETVRDISNLPTSRYEIKFMAGDGFVDVWTKNGSDVKFALRRIAAEHIVSISLVEMS